MDDRELYEIEVRVNAASPGPWFQGYWSGKCGLYHGQPAHPGPPACVYTYHLVEGDDYFDRYVSGPEPVTIVGAGENGPMISRQDAEFIANARQDIPRLLAEIARLKHAQGRPDESTT